LPGLFWEMWVHGGGLWHIQRAYKIVRTRSLLVMLPMVSQMRNVLYSGGSRTESQIPFVGGPVRVCEERSSE
jgi:hypothetical protein